MYGVIIGCHDTSLAPYSCGHVVFPGLEVEQYAIAYSTSKLFF